VLEQISACVARQSALFSELIEMCDAIGDGCAREFGFVQQQAGSEMGQSDFDLDCTQVNIV
jgi:hypothetical protein